MNVIRESSDIFKAYINDESSSLNSWEKNLWLHIELVSGLNDNNTTFHLVKAARTVNFKLLETNPYKKQLKQMYPIPIYEDQLTSEMIDIIRRYTSNEFAKANMKLLTNFDIDWNFTNKLRSIIRSLRQSDLRDIYYRGVNLSDIEIEYYKEKVNKCYYTNSFLSFTTERELAFPGNTLMILKTNPGNRLNIANVWQWSYYPHEMEAILSVGSKLKVLNVDQTSNHCIIEVELVGND